MAALWRLPAVYVCENNGYAATTPLALSHSVPGIAARASAYGMPAEAVDGQDLEAVQAAVARAVARARAGLGPSLVEAKTYRYDEHAVNLLIPAQYRSPEEIAAWRAARPRDAVSRAAAGGGRARRRRAGGARGGGCRRDQERAGLRARRARARTGHGFRPPLRQPVRRGTGDCADGSRTRTELFRGDLRGRAAGDGSRRARDPDRRGHPPLQRQRPARRSTRSACAARRSPRTASAGSPSAPP